MYQIKTYEDQNFDLISLSFNMYKNLINLSYYYLTHGAAFHISAFYV